jgi:hypothetical protein
MWQEDLTPSFFHFVTCLDEETGHMLWAYLIFATTKRFTIKNTPDMVVSYALLMLSLFLSLQLTLWNAILVTSLFVLTALNSRRHKETQDTLVTFTLMYLFENFLINFLDLVFIRNVFSDYYHDDLFLDSFSFKSWQIFLTLLVCFVISQMQVPSVEVVKKNPKSIMFLFQCVIIGCLFMVGSFLYELTYEKADVRAKVFKSEISKIFFQILFYFFVIFI